MANYIILDKKTNKPYLDISWTTKSLAKDFLNDLLKPYSKEHEYNSQFKIVPSQKRGQKISSNTHHNKRVELYSSLSEEEKILFFKNKKIENVFSWKKKNQIKKIKDYIIKISVKRGCVRSVKQCNVVAGYIVNKIK